MEWTSLAGCLISPRPESTVLCMHYLSRDGLAGGCGVVVVALVGDVQVTQGCWEGRGEGEGEGDLEPPGARASG